MYIEAIALRLEAYIYIFYSRSGLLWMCSSCLAPRHYSQWGHSQPAPVQSSSLGPNAMTCIDFQKQRHDQGLELRSDRRQPGPELKARLAKEVPPSFRRGSCEESVELVCFVCFLSGKTRFLDTKKGFWTFSVCLCVGFSKVSIYSYCKVTVVLVFR